MTVEELNKVSFHLTAHMSMEYEHTRTYIDDSGRLGFCVHTPKREDGSFGRAYTHYRIDEKVFKSRKKFLEALKDFDYKIIKLRKGSMS